MKTVIQLLYLITLTFLCVYSVPVSYPVSIVHPGSGLVLDCSEVDLVCIKNNTGGVSQRWILEQTVDNSVLKYTIRCLQNGKVLAAADDVAEDGRHLCVEDEAIAGSTRYWQLQLEDGLIVSQADTSLAVGVWPIQTSAGYHLDILSKDPTDSDQIFEFIIASPVQSSRKMHNSARDQIL